MKHAMRGIDTGQDHGWGTDVGGQGQGWGSQV